MLRLRRYRYYVFFAAFVVFLLYRVTSNSHQWEPPIPHKPAPKPLSEQGYVQDYKQKSPSQDKDSSRFTGDNDPSQQLPVMAGKEPSEVKIPSLKPAIAEDVPAKLDHATPTTTTSSDGETKVLEYDQDDAAKTVTAALIDIPDKNVNPGAKGIGKGVHEKPAVQKPETDTTTAIHWTKLPEHFPVPRDKIIPLPTGKPVTIPTVQHAFTKESPEAQEKRLGRLAKVKAEMVRGWKGYMTHAKGHDELRPVSMKFRDPFCGWAATLVDALDTLWIMGMKDEFEEALVEVEKIDFTTSSRSEIPVFETTIRYLGGLIAAYDVSGGKTGGYHILLDKARELAEILMGVFDTPNRMPILYYNWKPAVAKLPKRAQSGVSVAELGSLSMEFTRLAQITGEDKYYDAVARITDAFYEWQERGTSIPGIFPEHVDASGCNKTVETVEPDDGSDANFTKRSESSETKADEDKFEALGRREVGTPNDDGTKKVKIIQDGEEMYAPSETTAPPKHSAGQRETTTTTTTTKDKSSTALDPESKKLMEGCTPQGLTPGSWTWREQYSMGGSQDSTYEYFPKQWLLLGGLEPKYKTLHAKVSAAVKKWLLYRPMVPDDRDILFSSKIVTEGNPETDAVVEWEITHLTCFIGGMFGMGGKIFDVPEDVEIGKKLTDGCVWAYENTPSGIMPEGGTVVPCAEANNCHWNETLYYQYLDPLYDSHDEQMVEYEKQMKEYKTKKAQKAKMKGHDNLGAGAKKTTVKIGVDPVSRDDANSELRQAVTASRDGKESTGMHKRAPPMLSTSADSDTGGHTITDDDPTQIPLQEVEEETDELLQEPTRPMSHEEYVKERIEYDNLPPGFVSANFHAYILR